ncbi:MAG: hypothetical protein K5945_01895 [Bacteroidaceae bacterium]|nr:hypothetical protein [Bacteroidaceae bacterium]
MKRTLLLAAVALMTAATVNAQEGYDDTKHEMAVTYGYLANSQWIDVLEEITTVMFGAKYENEKYFGPLTAEYFYHAKNWLGVGGIFAYGRNTQDIYTAGTKDGKYTHNYFTLMPAVKFDWLRKKCFGMYSKLAVGATLRTESIDCDTPGANTDTESAVHVNWQASLLGLEAGSPQVRGFVEFGFGEQGIALIGVRYKF